MAVEPPDPLNARLRPKKPMSFWVKWWGPVVSGALAAILNLSGKTSLVLVAVLLVVCAVWSWIALNSIEYLSTFSKAKRIGLRVISGIAVLPLLWFATRYFTPADKPKLPTAAEIAREAVKLLAHAPPPAVAKTTSTFATEKEGPLVSSAEPNRSKTPTKELDRTHERSEALSTVTESIWFGVEFDLPKKFIPEFKSGGVNTVDHLPQASYDDAWNATFGVIMPCEVTASSGMTFTVSQHPYIFLSVYRSRKTNSCASTAMLSIPAMVGSQYIDLAKNGYILGFDADHKSFTLRSFITAPVLRYLSQDISPQWRSFVIDEPKQLDLSLSCVECLDLPRVEALLPTRITVTTQLLMDGPDIIREYEFVPGIQQGRFVWRLRRYDEALGSFGGQNFPRRRWTRREK